MRTLPAVDLDIPAQSAWTWLVDALALLALITIGGWWLVAESALAESWRNAWLMVGVLIIVLALLTRRSGACRLRWDGRQWFCAPAARTDDWPLAAGQLGVMIDLQSAMLLRFEVDGSHQLPRTRWIAVRRRGLDAAWHELRCAVFSPQSGAAKAADDRSLDARQ